MNFNDDDLRFGDDSEESNDLLLSFCKEFKHELQFTACDAILEEDQVSKDVKKRIAEIRASIESPELTESAKIGLRLELDLLEGVD